MANGNNQVNVPTWANVGIKFVQSVGVPTAFLAVIVYVVGWRLAPPVLDAHVQFLNNTVTTQNKMSDTLTGINDSVEQIVEVEEQTKTFMENVKECHDEQTRALQGHDEKLDVLIDRLEPE